MPTFRSTRDRFNDALDRVDATLTQARALLDELPQHVATEREARQLLEAHQSFRETLRAHLRSLEKL